MAIKFYFNFKTSSFGRKEVEEFIGFDAVGFSLKQRKLGRDIAFAGNEDAKYQISADMNHCFDIFIEEYRRYRHEAQVTVEIDYGSGINVLGDVNFGEGFSTDMVNTAEFTVGVPKIQQRIRRNAETTINLLSNEAIIGGSIEPVPYQKALLKSKPIFQQSLWENAHPNVIVETNFITWMNPAQTTTQYDVKRTLSWLYYSTDSTIQGSIYRIIEAATTLQNVKIRIDQNILYQYRPLDTGTQAGTMRLFIRIGQTYESAQIINVWERVNNGTGDTDTQLPPVITYDIPFINQGDGIWLYYAFGTQGGAVNKAQFFDFSIKMTASSVAYNTVVPVIRYIDALRYAVKSATGMNIIAPLYDFGGAEYNYFITTSSLMRGLIDKPVNITLKTIFEKHIQPAINGDYQVLPSDVVVIQPYSEFYRNYEVGSFVESEAIYDNAGDAIYEGYTVQTNTDTMCNLFRLKFDNYASQKEIEQENTYDIVHGETEYRIPNENSENVREANIGYVYDPFLKEQVRRKSLQITRSTATQDDDKIYYFDMVTLPAGTNFTESAFLQHSSTGTDGNLILRVNQASEDVSFNWLTLGIDPSKPFQILSAYSGGIYTVTGITPNELSLFNSDFNPLPSEGQITRFKYFIAADVVLTDRTNEGFSSITGIVDGDRFGMLRDTTTRITEKWYNEELATLNICYPSTPIKNTRYLYNKEAATQLIGETIAIDEGENFIPTNPILDTRIFNIIVKCDLLTAFNTMNDIRFYNGFLRVIDSQGMPLRLYPKELEWLPLEYNEESERKIGTLRILGEEKYVSEYIDIYADTESLIINGEIQPTGFKFSTDYLGKIIIFDSTGKKLYDAVPYDKVRLNGAIAASTAQLGQWLSQYVV